MDGWSKVAAGVILGVAGTVYATNRRVRENLPPAARDLPDNVRSRFKSAVSAAQEASASRRQEILDELRGHAVSGAGEAYRPPRAVEAGDETAKERATTVEEKPPVQSGGGLPS